MPSAPARDAVTAASRFGFAARPGELAAIGGDARGWVLAQLGRRPAPLAGDLPSSASMVVAEFEMRRDKQEDPGSKSGFNDKVKAVYLAEVDARMRAAAASDTP